MKLNSRKERELKNPLLVLNRFEDLEIFCNSCIGGTCEFINRFVLSFLNQQHTNLFALIYQGQMQNRSMNLQSANAKRSSSSMMYQVSMY